MCRLHTIKKRTSELDDRQIEISQTETQRENRGKNEQYRLLKSCPTTSNKKYVLGITEAEEERTGLKKYGRNNG